jgi:hypothetical protein
MNTYLIKTKKYNYFNENNDYIIRLLVDYYYTNVFQQIMQYKTRYKFEAICKCVLMVRFDKVSSSMLLDLSV